MWRVAMAVVAILAVGCAGESTIVVTVGGPGSVTSDPPGIDCHADFGSCSMTVGADRGVELIANTPAIGAEFVGWSGACSGQNPCIVDATADQFVGASFEVANRTLTLVSSGSGSYAVTSSPPGIMCSSGPNVPRVGAVTVPKNTSVLLESGHEQETTELVAWTGDPGCIDDINCLVVVDRDRTMQVEFAARIFLKLQVTGPGKVTGPNGLDCPGSSCRAQFPLGSVVTVHSEPSPGAMFLGWLGSCGATPDCTVTMNFQTTLIADFAAM